MSNSEEDNSSTSNSIQETNCLNLNLILEKSDGDYINDIIDYLLSILNGLTTIDNDEIKQICDDLENLIILISRLKLFQKFINDNVLSDNDRKLVFVQLTWNLRGFLADVLMKNFLFFNEIYHNTDNYDELKENLIASNYKLCSCLRDLKIFEYYNGNLDLLNGNI